MIGSTLEEFLQDIQELDKSEVKFAFRGKKYIMRKELMPIRNVWVFNLDEYENLEEDAVCLCSYTFWGNDNSVCAHRFETRRIFDGKTVREIEAEIEVLRD